MPRGGKRPGAGGKPTWKHGRTKPVRVPIVLSERVLEIARILDEEGALSNQRVIDLSGVSIRQSRLGPTVLLADLLRVGYEIRPEMLVRRLKASLSNDPSLDELLERAERKHE